MGVFMYKGTYKKCGDSFCGNVLRNLEGRIYPECGEEIVLSNNKHDSEPGPVNIEWFNKSVPILIHKPAVIIKLVEKITLVDDQIFRVGGLKFLTIVI
jgi:hypothetical protein